MRTTIAYTLLLWASTTMIANANQRVLLGELIPSTQGTNLGLIEVADAPRRGHSKWYSRRLIRKALQRAGVNNYTAEIPRKVRISRKTKKIESSRIRDIADKPLRESLSPCSVTSFSVPKSIKMQEMPTEATIKAHPPRISGKASARITLHGTTETRSFSTMANVKCPQNVIRSGQRVTIKVLWKNIRVSAPGIAMSKARIGDSIRVKNSLNNQIVFARVRSQAEVEVLR